MAVLPKDLSVIVADPDKGFRAEPSAMLKLIKFSCEADFQPEERVVEALRENGACLREVSADVLRTEFEGILTCANGGKGLALLTKFGFMDSVLGEDIMEGLSKREMEDYSTYVENINKTKPVRLRRLALFFKCFEPKKAERAIKHLNFSDEDEVFLMDGVHLLDKLYFITNKYELKHFMLKYGKERYEFLHSLSKAQRIVYDLPENRVMSREYIMDNIRQYDEPVFEEDLALTREDMKALGIGREEDYDRVIAELLDLVYIKPGLNEKEDLIGYAKKYSKHKWAGWIKKVKYIK